MACGKIVVAGAFGVVGRSVLAHFETLEGWETIGLSRRPPPAGKRGRFISVDLRDKAACDERLGSLADVTHLVYCANFEKPNLMSGWTDPDHVEINMAMFANTIVALEKGSPSLRHVTLLQGGKAYGMAVGPTKVPSRESDPRYLAPTFYYPQEDYIRARQAGKAWTWTILRPQWVCGFALQSPMNALSAIAVYATISRELGMPLRFPGGAPRVQDATDARLFAKAVQWAGANPQCANEIFNIVNGDCFTWASLWPRIATHFNMELGVAAPSPLRRIMPAKKDLWDQIVAKHKLEAYSLPDLVPNWEFTDSLLGYGSRPNPQFVSGIKARKFGFDDCVDSEEMFLDWLKILERDRIIPNYKQ